MTPEETREAVVAYAEDRKASEVVALDLRRMIGYTDYFVICTGRSDRQVKAIHDGIHQALKEQHGLYPRRVEGLGEGLDEGFQRGGKTLLPVAPRQPLVAADIAQQVAAEIQKALGK